MDWIFENPI